MSTRLREEIPEWAILATALLLSGSLLLSIASVSLRPLNPLVTWAVSVLGLLELAVGLFVVYLLYRFVLAVETIAEKL